MSSLVINTSYMFQAILASVVLTLGSGWLGIKLARHFNLLDIPGAAPHKLHRVPMPYAGGIALAITMIVLIIVSGLWKTHEIHILVLPAVVILVFGLWDDKNNLPAWVKFAGQLLAAVLLIASGVYIRVFEFGDFYLGGPHFLYKVFDWLLTGLWLIGVTNAFNLVDSMDGLAVGLSAWAFAFFMLATFDSQQITLSILSSILLGICIGLYFYNASPARLFLGDSGAQTLGFMLAAIAILYTPVQSYQASSWFIPILLVGIPIFDTTLVFVSRLRRKKPFYKGGRDHTYHRLICLGLDSGRAVMMMHGTALLLECVAFIAVSQKPLIANGLFVTCLVLGGLGIIYLDSRKRWS
jgi:UDP-GlcNAc:undecaprenyl-phosphate/decaprenyl-phosphate GlcNAc-1-phosphate transferase